MSTEYEFWPPLKYGDVLAALPIEAIKIDLRYGDAYQETVNENRSNGISGGRIYEGVKHQLLTNGICSCWLVESSDGMARIEVFSLQCLAVDGNVCWWASTFLKRFPESEIWDMCNAEKACHPPKDGYPLYAAFNAQLRE